MSRIRPIWLVAATLAAGLAVFNLLHGASEIKTGPIANVSDPTATDRQSHAAEILGTRNVQIKAIGHYRQTLLRPLFAPTRRPFVMPKKTKPKPQVRVVARAPEAPLNTELQLLGVIKSPNADRALIKAGSDKEGVWLRQGDEIEGWRVVEIETGFAALSARGQRLKLELYRH